jgi:membrane-associated phospholipid phosphatase
MDPLATAVAIGLLGPVVAGPLVAYVLERLSGTRRRTIEWSIILGAVGLAIVADLLQPGPGAGGIFTYILAALPGLITFLVWRSQLATALVSLAPMYMIIAIVSRTRVTYRPELALDRAIPLEPAWMLVYGSLYIFVVTLPILVVRERTLIRRAMQSYLLVMGLSYAIFLLYPTRASRPEVAGDGFAAWSLRVMYDIDPPYNCFPSLHVAYSFISALACARVHRGVGRGALAWASLIAVSTLFTKQHYVLDVIAGSAAAGLAYALFLRHHRRDAVPEADRRRAPRRALATVAVFALMIAGAWIAYRLQ